MIVIGIAGGTGCGKTTFVRKIKQRIPAETVVVIPQDAYYRDNSHLNPEERSELNFDHPDAIEFELLCEHVRLLQNGQAVDRPTYSFLTSTRLMETVHIEPAAVLIIEGILILTHKALLEMLDLKIFMFTDADQRLIRVVQRDVQERGRQVETVIQRYVKTVRPMHDKYVEPSKQFADLIIPHGGNNEVALNLICTFVHNNLK